MNGVLFLLAACCLRASGAASAGGLEAANGEAWRQFQSLPRPFPVPGRSGGERVLLERLSRAASEGERIAAAAALVPYVAGSLEVRSALIAVLEDGYGSEELRRQAAKSLSFGGHDSRVSVSLVGVASAEREPESLRVLAYKALYAMSNRSDVAQALRDAVLDSGQSAAVRGGAAWGAFRAANRSDVRDALLAALESGREDASLRLEALKSLFGSLNLARVRDAFLAAARDAREPSELRAAAALGLVRRTNESAVRDFLEGLAGSEADQGVRTAALRALSGTVDQSIAEFFHLDSVPPYFSRDPLLWE